MAHVLSSESFNFKAYMAETEPKLKVRKAGAFAEDLARAFTRREPGTYGPHMNSTKLGTDLEFRPGEVTVWAGYNGHKKSMFTGQVALDLCAQGERVLVASFEMQPMATLARMCRQATANSWPDAGHQADFMAWTDRRLWLFDHVGRISPALCIATLRYFADELQGQHVFIDSLMKVCQSEESLDEQKQLVSDLCDVAKETGLHVHMVAHCRKPQNGGDEKLPTRYDLRGSSAISDLPHNVALVWANKAKADAIKADPMDKRANEPDAMVIIDKQRNGGYEGKVKLWFDPLTLRFVNDRLSRVEPYDLARAHLLDLPKTGVAA